MNKTKECSKCHKTKPLDEFHNKRDGRDGKASYCKECKKEIDRKYAQEHKEENKEYQKEWYERVGRQKAGKTSMYENKLCSNYLGIVIGECLCRHLFKDVEVMPHGFPGYDVICNKGKKINVKTACMTLHHNKYLRWRFNIGRNKIADFFILVAFDNVEDLNPLHLWMIPGKEINNKSGKSIRPSTIHKWDKWERDINDAQLCCTEIKEANHEI